LRPSLELLEDRRVPATIYFGPNSGAWEDPANWQGGVLPGPNDTAVIAQPGVQVTASSNAVVTGLTLSGRNSSLDVLNGTLRVTSGSLAISNTFTALVDGHQPGLCVRPDRRGRWRPRECGHDPGGEGDRRHTHRPREYLQ
jgi:hypothetical protein